MSNFLRESKYRHISVSVDKRENHYEALRIQNVTSDNTLLAANSVFLAYVDAAGGGSAVAVIPLSSVGKNHIPVLAPTYQQPLVRGHSQAVTDLIFSPFHRHHLLTASNDGYLKTWLIPDAGYIVDAVEPLHSLQPLQGAPVKGICHHPAAADIIAIRGIKDIAIVDLSSSTTVATYQCDSDIQSIAFSYTGHMLLLTTKDKRLLAINPRTGEVLHSMDAHANHRSSRVIWLGDSCYAASFGFTATMDRELIIYNAVNWTIVYRERVDSSTGAAMPLYDADANLLLVAAKGGASLRVYEFDASVEKLFPICNAPVGEDAFRGTTLVSKQACNISNCEVLRVLKLTDVAIVPISIVVPRREKQRVHADLYPPTVDEAPPAITAAQWLAGQDEAPNRVALVDSSANVADVTDDTDTAPPAADSPPPEESSRFSMKRISLGSTLKYRHLYGVENTRANSYYNINPSTTTDSSNLAANDKFWAVPYRGAGGPVYVSRHAAYGKVEASCKLINGHRLPVLDLAFSPFHDDLLVTASDDSTVKLWRLPENGVSDHMSENDALVTLSNHTNSVRCCNFNPVAMNTLATASTDGTVRLWDITSGSELFCHAALPENATVSNMSFNYAGSQVAVACKDRVVRILDPRTSTTVAETPASAHGRNLRVTYCSTPSYSMVATACNATSGARQLALWDPRKMSEAAVVKPVDNAAGALFPMFDEDTGVIMLAGKGDTIIRYFELTHLLATDTVTCNKANEFQSSRDPIAGICLLPKRGMDVKNVEVCRLLKLTDSTVVPISFILPRAETLKQYFQDDVFLPTRGKSSSVSAVDYAAGVEMSGAEVDMESLHPSDMTALSDKPAEAAVKPRSTTFRETIDKAEEENKQRDAAFMRLQDLALQRSKYHPNPSGGGHGFKVDAAPVHDDDDSDGGWDDA